MNLFDIILLLPVMLAVTDARIESSNSVDNGRKRPRHSGRLLGRPDPFKCSRRPRQYQDRTSGHYYFFSEDTNFKVESTIIFYKNVNSYKQYILSINNLLAILKTKFFFCNT
jgi:hypothetical protein